MSAPPGSPWGNAYSETFNSRLKDELLDREVFETPEAAKVILEDLRLDSNHQRQGLRITTGNLGNRLLWCNFEHYHEKYCVFSIIEVST
ncbi:integrase core domain-containing protein [Tautonia marina]|uniref:integrase core domain-containing protein n=1 Tax=Tautonia marina TaxID=2653855 RepID=UPI001375680A